MFFNNWVGLNWISFIYPIDANFHAIQSFDKFSIEATQARCTVNEGKSHIQKICLCEGSQDNKRKLLFLIQRKAGCSIWIFWWNQSFFTNSDHLLQPYSSCKLWLTAQKIETLCCEFRCILSAKSGFDPNPWIANKKQLFWRFYDYKKSIIFKSLSSFLWTTLLKIFE